MNPVKPEFSADDQVVYIEPSVAEKKLKELKKTG